MKLPALLIYFFLFTLVSFGQETLITWNKNVKIAWSDFKGKAVKRSPFAAMSAVGINYKYNSWSNGTIYKIRFHIYSTFDKSRSWSKVKLRTPNMLMHEQLHFDIAALVCREFRREAETRIYSKNYKTEIEELFRRYSNSLQKFQQKYDLQTMHGKDKLKQKEWQELIGKLLK